MQGSDGGSPSDTKAERSKATAVKNVLAADYLHWPEKQTDPCAGAKIRHEAPQLNGARLNPELSPKDSHESALNSL